MYQSIRSASGALTFVKVPTQPNFCDCGVYLLHLAQTFMKDPQHYFQMTLVRFSLFVPCVAHAPYDRRPLTRRLRILHVDLTGMILKSAISVKIWPVAFGSCLRSGNERKKRFAKRKQGRAKATQKLLQSPTRRSISWRWRQEGLLGSRGAGLEQLDMDPQPE